VGDYLEGEDDYSFLVVLHSPIPAFDISITVKAYLISGFNNQIVLALYTLAASSLNSLPHS
jgi:hypothetical protein